MKVLLLFNGGFPYGMASTYRARLYAQALIETGVDVEVLALQCSNVPLTGDQALPSGEFNGIRYRYATGTANRPSSFWARRRVDGRTLFTTVHQLTARRLANQVDCVFYYGNMKQKNPLVLFNTLLPRMLDIPCAVEICERPWSIEDKSRLASPSPLRFPQGALVISGYLENWAQMEAARLKRQIVLKRIPILVDADEFAGDPQPDGEPTVLFSASPRYDSSLRFILSAMEIVWQSIPTCRLAITGGGPEDASSRWIRDYVEKNSRAQNIQLLGYLPREGLIERYRQSWALLAPLFDDVVSEARFPTKIGEYLAAGVPVITHRVGEIKRYLHDRIDAFVCDPENIEDYASSIVECLEQRSASIKIGMQGRLLARSAFDYRNYGKDLAQFFAAVAAA